MSKQKKPEASEPETEQEAEKVRKGPVVETNEEVEDLNAEAAKASDPYSRKPEVTVTEIGKGVKVETYL